PRAVTAEAGWPAGPPARACARGGPWGAAPEEPDEPEEPWPEVVEPVPPDVAVGVVPVRRVMRSAAFSVNHRLLSGPRTMLYGISGDRPLLPTVPTPPLGMGNSRTVPPVLMRPSWLVVVSTKYRAPSGPTVMPCGPEVVPVEPATPLGMVNSFSAPPVVMRPMRLAANSVNQRAPSGPVMMPTGWALGVGVK